MLIQCTKKLLDELGIKQVPQKEEAALFSWHANVITINRRKAVLMVNDRNRYVIVLYGLKKRDFQQLDRLISQAIKDIFQDECIDEKVIGQFMSQSGDITFTKTKDRSSITRVNRAAELVHAYYEDISEEKIIQSQLSIRISRVMVSSGQGVNRYMYPNKELYKDLAALCGKPAIRCQAAVLKVTLDLENFEVWRRLVVPLNYTFPMLHNALQIAFGWKDYHLHEFYLYEGKGPVDISYINHSGFHKEGYKPVLNLVCDDEALSYPNDVKMRMEKDIRLSEIPFQQAKYNYDFGDNWQHYIEVEEVMDDYDGNYPVCLDGKGDAPPEDVGGETGYDEFVMVMADENHPDHLRYKVWSESLKYEKFDLDEVNWRLRLKFD